MLAVRRHAERTVAQFRLLLEQLPFAFLWTTDADLRIAATAGGALTLLGIDDTEAVVGRELASLVGGNGGDDPLPR